MKNGNLVEIGPTKQILTNPSQIYTKSLVSSVPPTNKKILRFKIIEKENKIQGNQNIKILNRWSKKKIYSQDLIKVKNLKKTFHDSFFTEKSKNSVMAVDDVTFQIKEGKSYGTLTKYKIINASSCDDHVVFWILCRCSHIVDFFHIGPLVE